MADIAASASARAAGTRAGAFFKAFPAERGLVLLVTPEGVPGLQTTRVRDGVSAGSDITLSRTMLLLLQKKESFLSTHPASDERLAASESIQKSPIASVIGVPLKVKDKVGGIVLWTPPTARRSRRRT